MRGRDTTPATRSNLLATRRRLVQVKRGAALLERKREALIAELFQLALPASDARAQIVEVTRHAYPALIAAIAVHGLPQVRALGWPSRAIELEIRQARVWGVPVAEIAQRSGLQRSQAARGTAPGSTGPATTDAADQFERLLALLIEAAPREMLIRRLGEALWATSRQINVIEQRVEPELQARITRIREMLDERARDERIRLRKLRRVSRPAPPRGHRHDSM